MRLFSATFWLAPCAALVGALSLSGCDKVGESIGMGPDSQIKAVRSEIDRSNIGRAGDLLGNLEEKYSDKTEVALLRAEYEAAQGHVDESVGALRRYLALLPSGMDAVNSSRYLQEVRESPQFLALIIELDVSEALAGMGSSEAAGASLGSEAGVAGPQSQNREEIRAGDVSISIPQ